MNAKRECKEKRKICDENKQEQNNNNLMKQTKIIWSVVCANRFDGVDYSSYGLSTLFFMTIFFSNDCWFSLTIYF